MVSDCLIIVGVFFYRNRVVLIKALKKYVTHFRLLFDAIKMFQVHVVAISLIKLNFFSFPHSSGMFTNPDSRENLAYLLLADCQAKAACR